MHPVHYREATWGLSRSLTSFPRCFQVPKLLTTRLYVIAERELMQVMFGGTNINKDVSALNRGPPHILVGRLLFSILAIAPNKGQSSSLRF